MLWWWVLLIRVFCFLWDMVNLILKVLLRKNCVLFKLNLGEWVFCFCEYVFWVLIFSVFLLWLKVEMVFILMVLLMELRFWFGVSVFSILMVFNKFVGSVFKLILCFLLVLDICVLFMFIEIKFGFKFFIVMNFFLFLDCWRVILGKWCNDLVMFWLIKLFKLFVEIIELKLFFMCFKLWVFKLVCFMFLIFIIFMFCLFFFCGWVVFFCGVVLGIGLVVCVIVVNVVDIDSVNVVYLNMCMLSIFLVLLLV